MTSTPVCLGARFLLVGGGAGDHNDPYPCVSRSQVPVGEGRGKGPK